MGPTMALRTAVTTGGTITFGAAGTAGSTIAFNATFGAAVVEGLEFVAADAPITIGVQVVKGRRSGALAGTFPAAPSTRGAVEVTLRSFTTATAKLGGTVSFFTPTGVTFRAIARAIKVPVTPRAETFPGRGAIVSSAPFHVATGRAVRAITLFVVDLTGLFPALVGSFKEGPFGSLGIGRQRKEGRCGEYGASENGRLGKVLDSLIRGRYVHGVFLRQGRLLVKHPLHVARAVFHV